MIDLNRSKQPWDRQKNMVRKRVNRSLERNAPVLEKEIIGDSTLGTKWETDRVAPIDTIKLVLIAWAIIEYC